MHKVLLVEDEKNFGMVLRDYLRMNGLEVNWCENGEAGLQAFKESDFDICIVDVMMPRMDGFTLSTAIKQLKPQVPLVFLTARGLREDVLKGYKLGADDYIIKPFDSEVLLHKIRAILSRAERGTVNGYSHIHQLGSYTFDAKMRCLKRGKKEQKLSPKEAQLLELLCLHKNTVLPREQALKQIWKEDNYFTGRSMDVYIVKLRKYLSGDPKIEINNLHGNGYTLKVGEN